MERTLVVLKPDAVQRQLIGRVISRLEDKGLKIVAMKMMFVGRSLAEQLYAIHEGKDFYPYLVEFVAAGPVVALVLEGNGAVEITRSLIGPTFGPDAPAGTVRGDFGMSKRYNLIHASDSPAAAGREIDLFFRGDEVVDYQMHIAQWVYARRGGELV